MDEIKRLTPAQRARCNRLIRRLCANYDGGNCMPLDDGEGCVCVQMISYSLLCKYFRRAVLPADKVLCADIYRQRTRTCERCGKPFAPSSNRQKYCPECGCSIRCKQKADSARRRPASNIKRRESLDFRGFFEGKAGAGQLFDLGISKILGGPRPAPDALSRFASQLCQLAAGQRRSPQAHSGVAGAQRFYHHGEHLRPLGLHKSKITSAQEMETGLALPEGSDFGSRWREG